LQMKYIFQYITTCIVFFLSLSNVSGQVMSMDPGLLDPVILHDSSQIENEVPEPSSLSSNNAENRLTHIKLTDDKKTIGILEIQSLNQAARDYELNKVITEMLTTSFVNSNSFNIIEREQLAKVLNEIKLTHSGIVDESSVKIIGRMIGANAIVLGSITKLFEEIRLDIRLVDVESGLILTADSIIGRTDLRSISLMADTVVNNLIKKFLNRGAVVQQDTSIIDIPGTAQQKDEPIQPHIPQPQKDSAAGLPDSEVDESQKEPKSEKTWIEPVTKMEFVWVQGGCYQMGCGSWTGECYNDELPVHEVCVDDFWIGKYEVTQAQWLMIMGNNPSKFVDKKKPVEGVGWNYAQEFILNLTNRSPASGFRLPTEAEWEYACRSGGKAEKYSGGDDLNAVAWYKNNSNRSTQPVGTKEPNGLGLYDMSGNVLEWVEDRYSESAYNSHGRMNPLFEQSGLTRVYRGGSWEDTPDKLRCGMRRHLLPRNPRSLVHIGKYYTHGLRLVKTDK
jgi:formylglycine-generating enzyme required for sulfatase activity